MTTINWPAGLPNGYALTGEDETMTRRIKMDSGYVRQLVDSVDKLAAYRIGWHMRQEQYELFQVFHRDRLQNGSLSFNFPLSENGVGVMREVRFVSGVYSAQYAGPDAWDLSAVLEGGLL